MRRRVISTLVCVSASVRSTFEAADIVLEEVAFQYIGELQQQFGVDARAVEYLVDVRAVAIQLP